MSLSPQMREYFRLLQLPIADLCTAIDEALEQNPMLEEVSRPSEEDQVENISVASSQDSAGSDSDDETFSGDWSSQEPSLFSKLPPDFAARNHKDIQKIKDYQETLLTKSESLFDYLEWQIHFLELNEREKKIAEQIVGNIDADGYLKTSVEEIATVLAIPKEEVQGVLEKIHQLDPPGIGARSLQEALVIQLERRGTRAALVAEMVRNHLDLIAKKDFKMIGKIYGVSDPEARAAVGLVSRLEPKPGRSFYVEEPIAITPDATVTLKEGTEEGLEIEIHNEILPGIRINPEYRQMIRDKNVDSKTRDFLRERLTQGQDFLKALDLRKSTLRAVTEEIVRAQPLFFTRGFSHLRPLRLKDIGERLELHESTISRAIDGKYLKTPQGTIPYKSFFSQRLETQSGEDESQKSIMERIRRMIEKEDTKKPWSDQALVKTLESEGIKIARRTVTKYRELLRILPSHLRRER